jgi:hypothetical protein
MGAARRWLSIGEDNNVVGRRDEVERGSSGDANAWDKDRWSTWDGGDWRCTVTTMSPRMHCDWREPFKQLLRVTNGPGSISYFKSFSITQIFEIRIGILPDVENCPNFAGRQSETL